MKKVLLTITALALACGAAVASRPASRAEAMDMVRQGLVRKAPPTFRQSENGQLFGNYSSAAPHAIAKGVRKAAQVATRPPMKLTAGGSALYGWQASSYAPGFFPGMYELTPDGYVKMWDDPKFLEMDQNTMHSGWIVNGKVCGYVYDLYYGYIYGMYYEEIDFVSGKTLTFEELDDSRAQQFTVCTYRPSDRMVYGYGMCPETYDYAFLKVNPDTPGQYELLSTITNDQLPYAICHNPVDDTLYGVTIRQKVVKINYDGTQQELFALPYDNLAYYIAGMVFSPVENVFVMNVNYSDNTSELIRFNLDGTVEPYMELHYGESFNMLFSTDADVRSDSPARPELTGIYFDNGATSGYSIFRLPSVKVNGGEIGQPMSGFALIDGDLYRQYDNLQPGSELKVEYTDIPSGRHHFDFYLTCGDCRSGGASVVRWVGNDIPLPPTNVKLTGTNLSWEPVTQGVSGGFVDVDKMEYVVSLAGERYCVTKETDIEVEFPTDIEQQKISASVVARCNGMESDPAVSNRVLHGNPYTLPMHIEPNQEQVELCQVIDGNANGTGWQYNPFDKDFRCTYTSAGEGDMDDWVFLPYFSLDDTGVCYRVTFEAGLFTDTYMEESLEVFVGKAPGIGKAPLVELMTIPVVEEFCLPDFGNTYEGLFTIDEPGVYYLGFHCTSKEDQFGYWVKNVTVDNPGIQTASPGRVTDLTATGAELGVLEATVSFTMPLVDLSGNPLDAAAPLKAVIKAAGTTEVSAAPGEKVTRVITTGQGENQISVKVTCGDLQGLEALVNVYTGVEIPGAVVNINGVVSDDMRSFTLTWDGPEAGENGGYIVPSDIIYHIYKAVPTASGSRDLVKIDSTMEKSYTYTNTESQEFVELGVAAGNVAGECNMLMGVSGLVGVPYTLPIVERFDDPEGDMAQNPWLIYSPDDDYTAYWGLGSPHDIDSGFEDRMSLALIASVRYDGGKGCIGIPRISTKGQSEVTVKITAYEGEKAGDMSLTGECYGMDNKLTVGTMTCKSSGEPKFTTHTLTLPAALLDKEWVQLYVECDLPDPMHSSAFNFLEITGKTDGIISVGSDTQAVVTAGHGFITVNNCQGSCVAVTEVSGVTVASVAQADAQLTVTVAPGVYLVNVDGNVSKVAVK